MSPVSHAKRILSCTALLLVIAGCGQRHEEDPARLALGSMSLEDRIAQTLVVPLSLDTAVLGRFGRGAGLGGVLVDSGEAIGVSRQLWRLRRYRGTMPLVIAPLGRGVGALLDDGTEFPPARAIAALEGERASEVGAIVGREAGALGIDLGLVRAIPTRDDEPLTLIGRDPVAVRNGMAEWIRGMSEAGVLPVLELFWSTDTIAEAVRWDLARLSAIELKALSSAVENGAGGILTGHLILPALTGDTTRLPYSAAAVGGLLRREAGRDGLILVRIDASGDPKQNAVAAIAAGADLLLGVHDPDAIIAAVGAAVADGRIPATRIDSAAVRVIRRKLERAARPPPPLPDSIGDDLASAEAREIARAMRQSLAGIAPGTLAEGLPQPAATAAPVLKQVDPAEVGMSEAALAEADAIIRQAIADSIFPGAALAVGRSGGLVRLTGYGELDYTERSREVDGSTTIYDLASLSKIIGTTAAVMELVEESRLDLDASVQAYVPEFRGAGKGGVTLRHLLTHTSGLPAGIWLYGSARSREEALRQVIQQPLKWEPGERVQYSDLGMILMAEIAERAAGMPLDQFLALRVYAPLGMSSTMYLPPITLQPQIAPTAADTERPFVLQGVVHDANSFRLGGIAGHAGIFSTARDIAVFALTMLNGGSYGNVVLYDPETVDRFTTRQPGAEQRALGWDTPSRLSPAGRHFSEESFGHTGYTGTSLWIEPTKDLYVVFLTNRTYSSGSAREIFRVRRAVHEAIASAIVR